MCQFKGVKILLSFTTISAYRDSLCKCIVLFCDQQRLHEETRPKFTVSTASYSTPACLQLIYCYLHKHRHTKIMRNG